ncbi:MAG: hypothetical protein KDE24_33060, partial [Caldilinea sp.]|nr:hypothetical protein [Caldilinea sp.]
HLITETDGSIHAIRLRGEKATLEEIAAWFADNTTQGERDRSLDAIRGMIAETGTHETQRMP